MAHEPRIIRQRFYASPFSAEQMQEIGTVMIGVISTRIRKGLTDQDTPAKELTAKYAKRKILLNRDPIRDWYFRGRTLGFFKVVSASESRCEIGFVDQQADAIAHFNNLRVKQFGVSPKDRNALTAVVLQTLQQRSVVRIVRAA